MKKTFISTSVLACVIAVVTLMIMPAQSQAQPQTLPATRQIGKAITNVKLPDTAGKIRNLTSFVGKKKVVLIDFWATWCRPCCMEMPNVKAAYDKYHKKGFNVVGISFDTNGKAWKDYIKNNKLNWTHLSDLNGWKSAAQKTYEVMSIPSSILVDGNGKIIANDLRGEELQKKLKEIYGY